MCSQCVPGAFQVKLREFEEVPFRLRRCAEFIVRIKLRVDIRERVVTVSEQTTQLEPLALIGL